jgi:geranylgeranyl diphosphate synthase type 3
MQFEGSAIKNLDYLTSSLKIIFNAISNKLPQLQSDLLELFLPNNDLKHQQMKQALSDRASNWAKVNMSLVDHLPKQFPDSLSSYIDITNPIFNPLIHVVKQKGSMNRVLFTTALNTWYRVPIGKVSHLLETGQCLHNCSLLIDDIMDETPIRRNEKTAHEIFGKNLTMGSAYTSYFQILISTYLNLGTDCMVYYLEETSRAHIGQLEDVYYRDKQICPSEEKYIEIIGNKTGSFFRAFSLCLSALSDSDGKEYCGLITEFSDKIGLMYQIRDDYMDLVSEEYFVKKGTIASDFEEGKFSYPVIICLQQFPEYEQEFKSILGKKGITLEDKKYLIEILHQTNSLTTTEIKLQELLKEIIDLYYDIVDNTGIANKPMLDWIQQLSKGIGATDSLFENIPAKSQTRNKTTFDDPFEIKEIEKNTISRVLRNVICTYHIYYKANRWTESQFWETFPLLIAVESMIMNIDNKNEEKEVDAPIITLERLKSSKSWKLISKSSFYSSEMEFILESALEYYHLERLWYDRPESVNDLESVLKMNHFKSTNFRILSILSKNIHGSGYLQSLENLEDYVSLTIEEAESVEDNLVGAYNVYNHFLQVTKSDAYFQSKKSELCDGLNTLELDIAQNWLNIYLSSSKFRSNKNPKRQISQSNIYAISRIIAVQCIHDPELSEFTLHGNFKWCINRYFEDISKITNEDSILRRLQTDMVLSLNK